MSARAGCVDCEPGGPRSFPDTRAVLASMSQNCCGVMTNRCPSGVRPCRFMPPVPNATWAASPTLLRKISAPKYRAHEQSGVTVE